MKKDFLRDIISYKKEILYRKKVFLEALKKNTKGTRLTSYHLFRERISQSTGINLIAEVKKASPSKGIIRNNFDPVKLATIYKDCGAVALSVLSEDKYFLGKLEYIRRVSDHCAIPVLAKDFVIDEVQIYEAFHYGASAVLLIAAILKDDQLSAFLEIAADLDMDCLIEIHNEEELARALACGAQVIGVNNRDLVTFQVSLATCQRLIPLIPKDKIIVAESGIKTHADVLMLQQLGAHAVLIGETFMRERDVAQKVKEVMGF